MRTANILGADIVFTFDAFCGQHVEDLIAAQGIEIFGDGKQAFQLAFNGGFVEAQLCFVQIDEKSVGGGDISSCFNCEFQNLAGILEAAQVVEGFAPFLQGNHQGCIVLIELGESCDIGSAVFQLKVSIGNSGEIYNFFIFQSQQFFFGR